MALGHAQAKALGFPDLPIAVVPHPFGSLSREKIQDIAEQCADDIARLLCELVPCPSPKPTTASGTPGRAALIEVPDKPEDFYSFLQKKRWGDGLPLVPPTSERVALMLTHTRRDAGEVIATVAPAYGAATIEGIAINAVLAGCRPEYLPVLIAATQAMADPAFDLQNIQSSTNTAAVWLVINGPIARQLNINSGGNCLGPGDWANATLGRAVRLIMQNIGGGLPREMDLATHGQPGKFTFCCAESEEDNPWEPLHVERGYARERSTVTVVGALGTWSMNITVKDGSDLLTMIADTMPYTGSSDYVFGGSPWILLGPEHAQILKRDGYSKDDVKQQLWEQSKLRASRVKGNDFERMRNGRRGELGEIGADTMVPISRGPKDINIIVAGGPGTHSMYVPVSGNSRSITRAVDLQ